MNLIERATIMHFHRHRIEAFGRDDVMALGWRNADSQQKRFEVIASLANFNQCTVLDVGCGRGDLKAFLDARFDDVAYIGIDQMPEFIVDANAHYANSTPCRFYEGDFTTAVFPRVDYVVASGALGYRSGNTDFLFDMICRLYASSARASIFNVLDAKHFPDHPLLLGRDCEQVIAYCRTLSPYVEVVRGYLPDDVTVRITRPAEI
jgi:SAM-dependent methyltransferase